MAENNQDVQLQVDVEWVNKMLDELSFDDRRTRNFMRSVLRKAGRVIRDEARSNLQSVRTKQGRLKTDNLVESVKMTVYRNTTGVRVDAMPEKRSSVKRRMVKAGRSDHSFVLRFVEGGTKPRTTKGHWNFRTWIDRKRVIHRGRPGYRGIIPASHFLQRAWDSKKDEAQHIAEKGIVDRINRIAKRKRR